MNEKSSQYFNSVPWKSFLGVNQLKIAYKHFPCKNAASKKAIVFLTGQGEPIEKYSELLADLHDSNFQVYSMDHRGQGQSDRVLQAKPRLGYVESFENYVEDLQIFIRDVVKKENGDSVFVLAHSMGGAVATLFALTHPEMLKGMALSAPMYDVVTSPYPGGLARWITAMTVKFGLQEMFPVGKSDFNVMKNFKGNQFTNCEPRFEAYKRFTQEFPQYCLQGPSNQWVHESFKAMQKIIDSAYRLKTPTLIFQAGEEQILKSQAQNLVAEEAKRAGGNVRIHRFEQSQHEIFFEVDSVRKTAITQAVQFFESI